MVNLIINLFQRSSFINFTSFFFIFYCNILRTWFLNTLSSLFNEDCWCCQGSLQRMLVEDYKETVLLCFWRIWGADIIWQLHIFTMVESKCTKHVKAESRMNQSMKKNIEYRILLLEMGIDHCLLLGKEERVLSNIVVPIKLAILQWKITHPAIFGNKNSLKWWIYVGKGVDLEELGMLI